MNALLWLMYGAVLMGIGIFVVPGFWGYALVFMALVPIFRSWREAMGWE